MARRRRGGAKVWREDGGRGGITGFRSRTGRDGERQRERGVREREEEE